MTWPDVAALAVLAAFASAVMICVAIAAGDIPAPWRRRS